MQSVRLFAYGTLLDPIVQQRIIGREVPTTSAVLEEYIVAAVLVDNTTYPRIEQRSGGIVTGGVLLLTEAELARTDDYEGEEYDRIMVTLQDGSSAFVYVRPVDD